MRRFYESLFIGHWPEDLENIQVARTVREDHVVDEVILTLSMIARCRTSYLA